MNIFKLAGFAFVIFVIIFLVFALSSCAQTVPTYQQDIHKPIHIKDYNYGVA